MNNKNYFILKHLLRLAGLLWLMVLCSLLSGFSYGAKGHIPKTLWTLDNNPAPALGGPSPQELILSQKTWFMVAQRGNASNAEEKKPKELNAYDPFADYSEFENTADEQKNINFFQNGRFITLGAKGGVKLFTLNMSALYNVGPAYGAYLNYFFDMNFAIQFAVTASTHPVAFSVSGNSGTACSVNNSTGSCFVGSADFFSMGIDFKYFVDKSLFNRHWTWLQPYFFLGVLRSSLIMTASFSQEGVFFDDSGYGVNVGLGLEFHFIKKFHLGLQYAFQFVTLEKESLPINFNSGSGTTSTQSVGFLPYGDWMNITMLLGVNF